MLGATLFGAGSFLVNPQAASARKEVADGGLPPGIAEYVGVVKSKKQWNQIGKRVNEGHDEMPDEEWTNIQVSNTLTCQRYFYSYPYVSCTPIEKPPCL
jgi:hypothetical protein